MLVKPARTSNLAPLTADESRFVATHIWEALILIPRHRHTKGINPDECDNCIMLRHLITAFRAFKRIGE